MGLREGSFARTVVQHAASKLSENRNTGAGSDCPCMRRTESSRDRQSTVKVFLRPHVLNSCSDLKTGDRLIGANSRVQHSINLEG